MNMQILENFNFTIKGNNDGWLAHIDKEASKNAGKTLFFTDAELSTRGASTDKKQWKANSGRWLKSYLMDRHGEGNFETKRHTIDGKSGLVVLVKTKRSDANTENTKKQDKTKKEIIPILNGIKISDTRGPIGNTWQSRKWVNLIEFHGDRGRMAQGRIYAQKGQIIEIITEPGKIISKVQGSSYNPYKVEINISIFSEEFWNEAIKEMSKKAIFMAKMLSNEVPEEICSVFESLNLSLIPKSMNEIYAECTCPNYENPCKHIAATYYVFAELIDMDQFLFLFLRGCNKDKLIEGLRNQRNLHSIEKSCINKMHSNECLIQFPKKTSCEKVPIKKYIENFWSNDKQDMDLIDYSKDEVNDSIIEQFDGVELSIRGHKLHELIDKTYNIIKESIPLKKFK